MATERPHLYSLFLSSARNTQPLMREYIVRNAYTLAPDSEVNSLVFAPLIVAGGISLAVMTDRLPGALNDTQRGINYIVNQILIR